jgi:hypothetical protein
MCWIVARVTPAFTRRSVSEAIQKSSNPSGTLSSAALVSVVGALAMNNTANQEIAPDGEQMRRNSGICRRASSVPAVSRVPAPKIKR